MTQTAIRERGLICTAEQVRAIQNGATQFRRVVNPQPIDSDGDTYGGELFGPKWYEPGIEDKHGNLVPGKPIFGVYDADGEFGVKCPFVPGDRLYVREAWCATQDGFCVANQPQPGCKVWYKADNDRPTWAEQRWKPSIHMPRWASRITLEVKRVWVERVKEINGNDSLAEGIVEDKQLGMYQGATHPVKGTPKVYASPILAFMSLWDSINAKTHPWASNPWVWCVEFERIEA